MRNPATSQDDPDTRTVRLGGQAVTYRLRRSARSRGVRVVIDPREGLVVSVPPANRRGWAHPEPRIDAFLRERERRVLRHLGALAREWAAARTRGGPRDGGQVLYRGVLHRVRVGPAAPSARRSLVERTGGDQEDELLVSVTSRERRPLERILEAWLRDRAAEAIDAAIALHAPMLGVHPAQVDIWDPTTRWGSASRKGRLMFSWRLVLAPPGSLESVVVHELAHLRVFGHGPKFWALVAGIRPTHLADRSWLRRNSHALHSALDPVEDPPAGS